MPDTQSLVFTKTIILTDAQIKTLPTTGILIVTPQGAGKVTTLTDATFHFNIIDGYTLSNAAPITGDSELKFVWGSSNEGIAAARTIDPTLVIILPSGDLYLFVAGTFGTLADGSSYNFVPGAPIDNQGLYFVAYSEDELNWIGGNPANTITINISYKVIDI